MARSASQDRTYYAHILDGAIVAGVITIILHVVLSSQDIVIPEMLYVGGGITLVGLVLGLYFLKRRKDAP